MPDLTRRAVLAVLGGAVLTAVAPWRQHPRPHPPPPTTTTTRPTTTTTARPAVTTTTTTVPVSTQRRVFVMRMTPVGVG